MRHYTLMDMHYFSDIENQVMTVTDAGVLLELPVASKKLLVRNDGPNDAFLEFEADVATTAASFKLAAADGLVELPEQAKKIAAICAGGEAASVRIGICR